jgi:hypothetical protein
MGSTVMGQSSPALSGRTSGWVCSTVAPQSGAGICRSLPNTAVLQGGAHGASLSTAAEDETAEGSPQDHVNGITSNRRRSHVKPLVTLHGLSRRTRDLHCRQTALRPWRFSRSTMVLMRSATCRIGSRADSGNRVRSPGSRRGCSAGRNGCHESKVEREQQQLVGCSVWSRSKWFPPCVDLAGEAPPTRGDGCAGSTMDDTLRIFHHAMAESVAAAAGVVVGHGV